MVSHLLAITPSIGPSQPWGANPSFPQALVDLSLSRAPTLRGPTQAPVAGPTPMRQQRPDRSCRLVDAGACRTWQPRRPLAIGFILGLFGSCKPASVDGQCNAGGKAGGVAQQVQDGCSDFLRRAETPGRDPRANG